jgi:hypothetical protein
VTDLCQSDTLFDRSAELAPAVKAM